MGSCKMSNAQETVAKEYAIKLMLCKAKKKILFAEVPSDFMDCWLNFLQKPFYEIVSSTRNNACATWKGSIDRLPTTLFNENPCKDSSSGSSQLSIKFTNYRNDKYFASDQLQQTSCSCCGKSTPCLRCPRCQSYYFCKPCSRCASCGQAIINNGYTKENLIFIVSNDFQFYENSSIKAIELINQNSITNLAELSSAEVKVSPSDMKHFLSSLLSNSSSVLQDTLGDKVFCETKKKVSSRPPLY